MNRFNLIISQSNSAQPAIPQIFQIKYQACHNCSFHDLTPIDPLHDYTFQVYSNQGDITVKSKTSKCLVPVGIFSSYENVTVNFESGYSDAVTGDHSCYTVVKKPLNDGVPLLLFLLGFTLIYLASFLYKPVLGLFTCMKNQSTRNRTGGAEDRRLTTSSDRRDSEDQRLLDSPILTSRQDSANSHSNSSNGQLNFETNVNLNGSLLNGNHRSDQDEEPLLIQTRQWGGHGAISANIWTEEPASGENGSFHLRNRNDSAMQRTRYPCVDALRGLAIVFMIFCNYGGGGYSVFQHSAWDGLTVADLVFPVFIFSMGICIGLNDKATFFGIVKRSLVMMIVGLVVINGNNAGVKFWAGTRNLMNNANLQGCIVHASIKLDFSLHLIAQKVVD